LSKGEKNDYRDAEAIAEAVQRPTMKFVATKTAEQLDLQALHRVRERLVGQRTSATQTTAIRSSVTLPAITHLGLRYCAAPKNPRCCAAATPSKNKRSHARNCLCSLKQKRE
jgi:transposase